MTDKLSWLDRLLIKIAVAKAVARGNGDALHSASGMLLAFEEINEDRRCTSQSTDCEAKQ